MSKNSYFKFIEWVTFIALSINYASAQNSIHTEDIDVLRAKIAQDKEEVNTIANQIYRNKNSSSEKIYIDAKLNLDGDREKLHNLANVTLQSKKML